MNIHTYRQYTTKSGDICLAGAHIHISKKAMPRVKHFPAHAKNPREFTAVELGDDCALFLSVAQLRHLVDSADTALDAISQDASGCPDCGATRPQDNAANCPTCCEELESTEATVRHGRVER